MITGLDLRVHLTFSGLPACGAGDESSDVTPMVTLHGAAVTCSACLASPFFVEMALEAAS